MTQPQRCNWSDLYTTECAHCRGIDHRATITIPIIDHPEPTGRRIWPPTNTGPDHITDHIKLPSQWLPENSDDECRCGRPTRDRRYACDDCADLLSQALGDVPWTLDQLDITITREKGTATVSGPAGGNDSLPFHERASTAKSELGRLLSEWVRLCTWNKIRHSSHHDDQPTNATEASRWLLWRVDGLTLHPDGPAAIEQIVEHVAECRRIVTWKRKNRVYLGPCRFRDICDGEVYADEDATDGNCDTCDTEYNVAETRTALQDELDDKLYTAHEIARLAVFLGLEVPRERVRNQIRSWENRGRITPKAAGAEGQSLFRYGDVKPLLFAQWANKGDTRSA